jgi:hypothetical protein
MIAIIIIAIAVACATGSLFMWGLVALLFLCFLEDLFDDLKK